MHQQEVDYFDQFSGTSVLGRLHYGREDETWYERWEFCGKEKPHTPHVFKAEEAVDGVRAYICAGTDRYIASETFGVDWIHINRWMRNREETRQCPTGNSIVDVCENVAATTPSIIGSDLPTIWKTKTTQSQGGWLQKIQNWFGKIMKT